MERDIFAAHMVLLMQSIKSLYAMLKKILDDPEVMDNLAGSIVNEFEACSSVDRGFQSNGR